MWTKQRQRHDFDDSVDCQESKTKAPYEHDESWEEQAFAEDAAGPLGGCVWPPRSYFCSFCRREFRSAQALGGHMNVHRRDRARLKQSPNPQNNTQNPFKSPQVCTVVYDVPNPKTSPFSGFCSIPSSTSLATHELNLQSTDVLSCSHLKKETDKKTRISDPTRKEKSLNFGLGQSRPASTISGGQAEAATSCKRRKTEDEIYVKSGTLIERHHHQIQPEVIGLSPSSLHDLDLELRLGGFSNI